MDCSSRQRRDGIEHVECGQHHPAFKDAPSVDELLARIGKRPPREHDYGSFDHCDREVWFKIDYFDLTLEQASPDPAGAAVTKRIMTIGLAQDW